MIYYIIFSLIVFFIVNKIFNLKNLFNPLVFIIISHFVFFYLGLFYKDSYRHIKIEDITVLLINYSFVFILIGGILSRYALQSYGNTYVRFPFVNIDLKKNNKIALVGYLFLAFGILCTLKYYISAGGIVIFMEDVENKRILTRKGNGLVIQLAINFFTFGLLIVMMLKASKFFKTIIALFVFFFIISFGNRGPALYLLVFVVYVIQSVYRIEFSFKKIAIVGLALFSLMVFFGALRTNYDAELSALFKARFAWRPFVNIQNFQLVLDYFPEKHDFLLGRTYLQDISMLLPGSHPNSGTYLKDLMELKFDGGSITPSYLGFSYVNFGYIGLLFSPILYGFIANTFYEVYVRNVNMKNPLNLILLILFSFNFAAIVSSGLMTVLIQNMSIIVIVFITYIIMLKFLKGIK